MGDPVTGYVIYYQPEGGAASSDIVSGGETETHLLDGLQRGLTYNISIVALSLHLPSLLVGPVTVATGLNMQIVQYNTLHNTGKLSHETISSL